MSFHYYYRCFSLTSDGAMRSGAYDAFQNHTRLSDDRLLAEFKKHRNINGHQHTELVSVTDRPLEALNRALNKHYDRGEDPSLIWIVCIQVPNEDQRPHHALELANRLGLKSNKYKHEHLFEWEIPEQYRLGIVSLESLLNRGIRAMIPPLKYGAENRDVRFSELQYGFRDKILSGGPYETGRWLYGLAETFGMCVPQIAFQIYLDSLGGGFFDRNNHVIRYQDPVESITIELGEICEIEQVIRSSIEDEHESWIDRYT